MSDESPVYTNLFEGIFKPGVTSDQGYTNRCSLAAGLRGNEERMRKLRGNGDRMRK